MLGAPMITAAGSVELLEPAMPAQAPSSRKKGHWNEQSVRIGC